MSGNHPRGTRQRCNVSVRHRVLHHRHTWRARCSCGWAADYRLLPREAQDDASGHRRASALVSTRAVRIAPDRANGPASATRTRSGSDRVDARVAAATPTRGGGQRDERKRTA